MRLNSVIARSEATKQSFGKGRGYREKIASPRYAGLAMTRLILFALLLFLGACGNGEGRTPLTVLEGDGPKARQEFSVELELTPAERAQGMMFRKELGADRGMLFIFPQPVDHSFWMRNTLIPLDIIFIGADKKIVNIVARAEPQTETPREPDGFYQYTLEIEGGRADAVGIQAGDTVVFELPAGAVVK